MIKAVREALRLLARPCEDMARLASESLDRELTKSERIALRIHLFYCAACRRYRAQIEWIRIAMKRSVVDLERANSPIAGGMPPELRERLNRLTRDS